MALFHASPSSPGEATGLGVLMSARGLMELVLTIGLEFGVVSPALFAMLVIMAPETTFGECR